MTASVSPASLRRVSLQSQVAAVLVIVPDVRVDQPDEMLQGENYDMVEHLAT